MYMILNAKHALRAIQHPTSSLKQQLLQSPTKKIRFTNEPNTIINEDTLMRDSAETSYESTQQSSTPPPPQLKAETQLDTSKLSFLADEAEDPEVFRAGQALMRLKRQDTVLEKQASTLSTMEWKAEDCGSESEVSSLKRKGKWNNVKRR